MKGDITLAILKNIQAGSKITADILDTLSYFGYAETNRRMRGLMPFSKPSRKFIFEKTINKLKMAQNISKLLYKLEKEGLVAKQRKTKFNIWEITRKGKEWLKKKNSFLRPDYEIKKSNELKLIIFDIPEQKRKTRSWLRQALKNLDFRMLQKSVWIGKTILPPIFLDHLSRLEITSYVEIFSIGKTGTIKQIQ